MNRRLLCAAVTAGALAACGKTLPSTYLIEQEGHAAIAIKRGERIEVYPLPDRAVVIVDGKLQPLGTGSVQLIPRCPCDRPECNRYCMPGGRRWWLYRGDPRLDGAIDPVPGQPGQPVTGPRQPGDNPGNPGGDPLTQPPP